MAAFFSYILFIKKKRTKVIFDNLTKYSNIATAHHAPRTICIFFISASKPASKKYIYNYI